MLTPHDKFFVGLAGGLTQFAALGAGCTDPRVHGVIGLVTAALVWLTPNK